MEFYIVEEVIHFMEVKKTIEIMLLQFLSGEISKEALYGWTVNILHK